MSKRGPGRPVDFSKTLDAACLFRELRRRGLSYRKALGAVDALLGVGKSGVERYQEHAIEPMDVRADRVMAGAVLTRWWGLARDGRETLTPEALTVVDSILATDWNALPPDDQNPAP